MKVALAKLHDTPTYNWRYSQINPPTGKWIPHWEQELPGRCGALAPAWRRRTNGPPRSGPSAENFAMVARVEGGPRGGVSRRAVDPPKQRAQSLQRRSGLLGAKNGRAGAVRERLGVRPLVGGMPRRVRKADSLHSGLHSAAFNSASSDRAAASKCDRRAPTAVSISLARQAARMRR
jgi:hypothetical protein